MADRGLAIFFLLGASGSRWRRANSSSVVLYFAVKSGEFKKKNITLYNLLYTARKIIVCLRSFADLHNYNY